jgi:heme/copper-type cytochrome/quinol oxidase subunit 2
MYFTVKVVSQEEYEQWVSEQRSESSSDVEVDGEFAAATAGVA